MTRCWYDDYEASFVDLEEAAVRTGLAASGGELADHLGLVCPEALDAGDTVDLSVLAVEGAGAPDPVVVVEVGRL